MVLHLGDHTDDARELQHVFPQLTVCGVRGNNDFFDRDMPEHAVVTSGGVRIFLTHGHREQVYMREGKLVAQHAREENCGLAFFGHTHRMYLERVHGVSGLQSGQYQPAARRSGQLWSADSGKRAAAANRTP